MHDEANLLRAICARPDDDAPRLAYADWLDEHVSEANDLGRESQEMTDQARFVRVQVGLARGTDPDRGGVPLDDTRRKALTTEAHDLLEARRYKWERQLKDLGATMVGFRRGFPEWIFMEAKQFIANATPIFAAAPVRSLLVSQIDHHRFEEFAQCPNLSNLTHLDLGGNYIGNDGARALAASPHLSNLAHLDLLGNDIGTAGARALAESPHLSNLTHLDLGGNYIGNDGARALAASPHLSNLTHLDLGGNYIGNDGARALAASPHLSNLTHLELGDNHYIGPDGARALAGSRHLAPAAKLSALQSAGFNNLARQFQKRADSHQPDGPG